MARQEAPIVPGTGSDVGRTMRQALGSDALHSAGRRNRNRFLEANEPAPWILNYKLSFVNAPLVHNCGAEMAWHCGGACFEKLRSGGISPSNGGNRTRCCSAKTAWGSTRVSRSIDQVGALLDLSSGTISGASHRFSGRSPWRCTGTVNATSPTGCAGSTLANERQWFQRRLHSLATLFDAKRTTIPTLGGASVKT